MEKKEWDDYVLTHSNGQINLDETKILVCFNLLISIQYT